MTHATECYPLPTSRSPAHSWTGRLLAIVRRFDRRRLASIDPEFLSPHLRRDLGLPDQGFHRPDDPWVR
jgi:hypothetical protein